MEYPNLFCAGQVLFFLYHPHSEGWLNRPDESNHFPSRLCPGISSSITMKSVVKSLHFTLEILPEMFFLPLVKS